MFYNIEARRALLDLESRSKLFYTFVSGAQGSGKSHLINALYQNLSRYYESISETKNSSK